jgi:hypothetical protein
VKSVVSDTELFDCYDTHSTLAQLKVVETFVELIDSGQGGRSPGLTAVAKSVESHTCTEDLVAGGVSCRTVSVPLGATTKPLAGCSVVSGTYPFPALVQPSEPVAMGTAALEAGLVKTVSVAKQVFDCEGDIGDLYLFAETGEYAKQGEFPEEKDHPTVGPAPQGPVSGVLPLGTRYEGVICKKDAGTAALLSCDLFSPVSGSG